MSGWKEDIWAAIREQVPEGEKFTLGWAYGFDKTLGRLHPENKNVRPKIRQVLQQLVAEGRLRRLSPGLYLRGADSACLKDGGR